MASLAASIETANCIADLHSRIHDDRRVSLTDFARGKAWRGKLADKGVLELEDRSGRIAWVVSEENMVQMVDYITELEEQMERESIAGMLEARRGREDWRSGADLVDAAAESLESRYDALVAAVER